jgi:membrane protein required for colicin V production
MFIDILCLAASAYGFFLGFKEGIVNTVFRTLSIFIAMMAAFKFSPYMTEMLEKGFDVNNPLMFIVGFVVTFFLVLWLLRLAGNLVTQGMEVAHVNLPNQVIGGTVLAFIFVIFYSIVVWFVDSAGMIEGNTKGSSYTFRYLEPLPQKTFSFLGTMKPSFQKFFQKTNQVMDGVEKSRVKHTETKTDIYDIQDNTNPNNQRAIPNQQPQRPSSNNPYDNSYQPEQ